MENITIKINGMEVKRPERLHHPGGSPPGTH